eukprot:TRINITY_DN107057_c0_g1_i1.p1 TRINITY_DN107057_c0_g1~~TRINITY_DN107057_c0_g1_i1.p1  ORF type:complete len:136 (-),score=12.25 TRINITY_DN107057_c0_g1_i1:1-408(-)
MGYSSFASACQHPRRTKYGTDSSVRLLKDISGIKKHFLDMRQSDPVSPSSISEHQLTVKPGTNNVLDTILRISATRPGTANVLLFAWDAWLSTHKDMRPMLYSERLATSGANYRSCSHREFINSRSIGDNNAPVM